MTKSGTAEDVRPLTSVEVTEISGGSLIAAANAAARLFSGWTLKGCGTDADGRSYCDFSIPKP